MRPLVTIGITAFNAESTIERAIKSALAQSWRPIEIIAVDDCSLDATPTILASMTVTHHELKFFRQQKNKGMAAAINRILMTAQGEFLALFDDDDESLPERIETQWNRIVEYEEQFAHGAPVVCHTARLQVYPDGERRIVPPMGQRQGTPAPAGLSVVDRTLLGKSLRNGYGACASCSQMARLSTYHNVGGFDAAIRRHSDTDIAIRLAMAGAHFVGVSQPLVVQTMTQAAEKTLHEEYLNTLVLLEKHREYIEQRGLYQFCVHWVQAKQAWLEGRHGDFLKTLALVALKHPLSAVTRLTLAIPNLGLNRAFSRFHSRGRM